MKYFQHVKNYRLTTFEVRNLWAKRLKNKNFFKHNIIITIALEERYS